MNKNSIKGFLTNKKYSYHHGHCMTMVLCHIPPFCSSSPKISEGYLILKIIFSMTKYLIKLPVVYFLSSVSTLKNSSEI